MQLPYSQCKRQNSKPPTGYTIKDKYLTARKSYKAMVRRKKRQAALNLHDELESFRMRSPHTFWKWVRRASGQQTPERIPIPLDAMKTHFEELNLGPAPLDSQVTPGGSRLGNPSTDSPITMKEVESAIAQLKSHKAPGWDGLTPAFFKLFDSRLVFFLRDIFNQVLTSGIYPSTWSIGVIKPIHKSGEKQDPSNYRGITLLSVMGKIFTAIIRARLLDWAETTHVINETQFGFRHGRRTTDPIFILNSVIQFYRKKAKPLFACFVDFKKAFDSISHGALWTKLASLGVSNMILTLLQSMYANAISVVQLGTEISSHFPCRKGVRQGCNLSPLLFNLFIADLEQHLEADEAGGVDLIHSKLRLLLFADDLVLLSESPEALQSSINSLSKYCLKWSLQVNLTKTKVVCFSRQRTTMSHMFHLSGSPITIASEYKYLGVLLSANGSLKPAISILASQANKATFSLIKTSMHLGHPKPTTLLYLFDTLVRPITEYGCEVWASDKAEEMEKVHKRFCKFALGLPTSACNAAVYGDLGRCPLENRRKIAMVKYWLRISTHWDIPPLLQEAYQLNICEQPSQWAQTVKTVLDKAGFSHIWNNPDSIPHDLFIEKLTQRLWDQYQQQWLSDLATSRKLRTYRLFKTRLEFEPYLNLPIHIRIQLARLRSSSHSLRIETGRYSLPKPTPLEERLCPSCIEIEDETHFLITCRLWQGHYRDELFNCCRSLNSSFPHMSSIDKLIFILLSKNVHIIWLTGVFVYQSFMAKRKL